MIELEAFSPSLLEPLQVPLIVAGFGALGVAFGRWTPQPVLAPVLTFAIFVGPIAWSIPWVVMSTTPTLPLGHTWLVGPPAGTSCSSPASSSRPAASRWRATIAGRGGGAAGAVALALGLAVGL